MNVENKEGNCHLLYNYQALFCILGTFGSLFYSFLKIIIEKTDKSSESPKDNFAVTLYITFFEPKFE